MSTSSGTIEAHMANHGIFNPAKVSTAPDSTTSVPSVAPNPDGETNDTITAAPSSIQAKFSRFFGLSKQRQVELEYTLMEYSVSKNIPTTCIAKR